MPNQQNLFAGIPLPRSRVKMNLAMTYILISITGGVVGQILLKKGMNQFGELTLSFDQLGSILLRLVTNPYVITGLVLYGISSVFWLAALSRVELSFAYPFVSLSYVGMLIASWLLFNEDLSLLRLLGTATIILGVLIVSRS